MPIRFRVVELTSSIYAIYGFEDFKLISLMELL